MAKPFKFGKKLIGDGHPAYIIAEIGINHEGHVDQCAKMIEEAAKAGADAMKLQTVDVKENYIPGTESYEIFSKAALTQDETAQMFNYANSLGIDALTTSPDPKTLEWVDRLEPAGHKISSGMMTNPVIIRKTCETGRAMLISTGLATLNQIDESIGWIREFGDIGKTGLFQCTSMYPAPIELTNLSVMGQMAQRYGMNVGFSDHTDGIEAAIFAVCAGAQMIEKHFSLDKFRPSYDHRLSLEPVEFTNMVDSIRNAEVYLGSPNKQVDGGLAYNTQKFLRCVMARQNINAGDLFTEDNITLKRPLPENRGLAPKYYFELLGKQAHTNLNKNDPVKVTDVKDLAE